MKEFHVDLGGKPRRLRYTSDDGRGLFRLFSKPLGDLIFHEIMGLGVGWMLSNTGNPEVQFQTLLIGLRHDLPTLTENTLTKWLDTLLESGASAGKVYVEAGKAALYSGIVTGAQLDFDDFVEKRLAEAKAAAAGDVPEGAPGNAPEPARTEAASS